MLLLLCLLLLFRFFFWSTCLSCLHTSIHIALNFFCVLLYTFVRFTSSLACFSSMYSLRSAYTWHFTVCIYLCVCIMCSVQLIRTEKRKELIEWAREWKKINCDSIYSILCGSLLQMTEISCASLDVFSHSHVRMLALVNPYSQLRRSVSHSCSCSHTHTQPFIVWIHTQSEHSWATVNRHGIHLNDIQTVSIMSKHARSQTNETATPTITNTREAKRATKRDEMKKRIKNKNEKATTQINLIRTQFV